MREQVQTQALARRNFLSFMEEAATGGALVPADELVTRKDLQAFKKEIAETVQSAVQQLLQQRQAALSTPPEEEARRRRMRSLAD